VKTSLLVITMLMLSLSLPACGKDDKSRAERDAEVQKTLQQGAQREQQMYQGMQKNVETLEQKNQEKKETPQK
jgi:hypothetical protein